MDLKKSSLEEKISKLAEHGESLRRAETGEETQRAKEGKIEKEYKETRIEKVESAIKSSSSAASSGAPTQTRAIKTAKDLKSLDKTSQVKSLVNLSFTKGVFFAVEVAKNLDDPYILDELHDELVKQFKELVKSGKIKQI